MVWGVHDVYYVASSARGYEEADNASGTPGRTVDNEVGRAAHRAVRVRRLARVRAALLGRQRERQQRRVRARVLHTAHTQHCHWARGNAHKPASRIARTAGTFS